MYSRLRVGSVFLLFVISSTHTHNAGSNSSVGLYCSMKSLILEGMGRAFVCVTCRADTILCIPFLQQGSLATGRLLTAIAWLIIYYWIVQQFLKQHIPLTTLGKTLTLCVHHSLGRILSCDISKWPEQLDECIEYNENCLTIILLLLIIMLI